MIDQADLNRKSEALSATLRAKLGLRGRSLETRLGRAGRLLPKRLRRAGTTIVEARRKALNPRLARLVDPQAVDTAFADLNQFLDGVDPKDRRKGKLLGWLAAQVFNLLLATTLLIALMRWQGVI